MDKSLFVQTDPAGEGTVRLGVDYLPLSQSLRTYLPEVSFR